MTISALFIALSLVSLAATLWQRERHYRNIMQAIKESRFTATWDSIHSFYGKSIGETTGSPSNNTGEAL